MAKVKTPASGRTLQNNRGNEIAIENVRPEHIKRDVTVNKVFDLAGDLQEKMEITKKKIMKLISSYSDYLKRINGFDVNEEDISNLQLSNYANTVRVVKRNNKVIEFDEHLQLAELKIKECMKKWGKDSHPALVEIINQVFKTDKKGFVNKNAILSLFQYKINNEAWKEAMELIKKSIQVVERKEYVMIQFRDNKDQDWNTLDLNFSSLEVE
jgi:hypothetical protein